MKKTKKSGSKKPAKKVVVKKSSTGASKPVTRVRSEVGILPLGDKLVVRPLSAEEAGIRSHVGIIIPETIDKEKSEQGIVVAVGEGKRLENGQRAPVSVSVGDKILFSKYGFDEVKVGGVEYYIVGEASVLAVLEK